MEVGAIPPGCNCGFAGMPPACMWGPPGVAAIPTEMTLLPLTAVPLDTPVTPLDEVNIVIGRVDEVVDAGEAEGEGIGEGLPLLFSEELLCDEDAAF